MIKRRERSARAPEENRKSSRKLEIIDRGFDDPRAIASKNRANVKRRRHWWCAPRSTAVIFSDNFRPFSPMLRKISMIDAQFDYVIGWFILGPCCPSELLRNAKNSDCMHSAGRAEKILGRARSSDGLSRRGTSRIIRPTETIIIIIISTSSMECLETLFLFLLRLFIFCVLFFHSSLITHFRWATASMSWCWWERISFVSIPEKSRVFCRRVRSEIEEKYFGWTLFVFGVSLRVRPPAIFTFE